VLVATIRALRHHGGARKEEYNTPCLDKVKKGFGNLEKHIENIKKFGITPVVAINKFPADTTNEIDYIIDKCNELGVKAVVAEEWAKGGEGMTDIAQVIVDNIEKGDNKFKPLYDWEIPIIEKIETIAKEIYGADGVDFSKKALSDLKKITNLGLNQLPVCMAKTQKSLSDDNKAIGRPHDFRVTVREFEYAIGAGFVIPILGKMMRMPGLPVIPASEGMHIDNEGKISGLS
jgi:formate--tetrahydrofolate ligase